MRLKNFALIFLLSLSFPLHAQKSSAIEILNADVLEGVGQSMRKLVGNVRIRQDSVLVYCDSAYQFLETNMVEGYHNVRINVPENTIITAEKLRFNGNTRIAELFGKIQMNDGKALLTTDYLTYDTQRKTGHYTTGGKLVSENNTLTSQIGEYNALTKFSYFKKNVLLVNPEYTLKADTLAYHTLSETAHFLSPTEITYQSARTPSEQSKIFCRAGEYDTKNKRAFFFNHAVMQDTAYAVEADSIWYDREKDFGTARSKIKFSDLKNTFNVRGDYAIMNGNKKTMWITRRAFLTYYIQNKDSSRDSLLLSADTLRAVEDTIAGERILYAYRHAKIFSDDLQAVADSAVYETKSSVMTLYHSPFIWSGKTQMTGEEARLYIRDKQVDSLSIAGKGFIVNEEDSAYFNQIKGKRIQIKFRDNEINRLYVSGNCESYYYARDEKEKIMGLNEALSSEVIIRFVEKKPKFITFAEQIDGIFHPLHEIYGQQMELKGFFWNAGERPTLQEVASR